MDYDISRNLIQRNPCNESLFGTNFVMNEWYTPVLRPRNKARWSLQQNTDG